MNDTVKSVAKAATPRKDRVSITGHRTKLQVTGEEPGFHYAWINDENVGMALDAWYEFVTHACSVGNQHVDVSQMQGAKISRNVGGGKIAHLMRVPQEYFDEDMAKEQRDKVDASEAKLQEETNSNGLYGTLQQGSPVFVTESSKKR